MASLLHDLLLDTLKRSEHLVHELDALEGTLPDDVEPFRERWGTLAQKYRGAIEVLLSDPDLQSPQLASNFYISYKAIMQFFFEVEAGPLNVLGRFRKRDHFVTRVVARLCEEIGYPDSAPLGSAGSFQFYGALPEMDLVIVPWLEPFHLLGLADLYHELAHFVIRRRASELVAPFHAVVDRVFDDLVEDAGRRNVTSAEVAAIESRRASWKRGWAEEFTSDMMAAFWAGPAFGWANVRLCTNMSSALFTDGRSHPADAARHGGVYLMLRRLGCAEEAERIEVW
ncbi:MAG: hypothetical protein GY856_47670, partial [bacterium]|nr:hypothetical protein [bacterium]